VLLFGDAFQGLLGVLKAPLGLHGWRGRKGAVAPSTFAGLGLVSQPPSSPQHPATGCLRHEADGRRVWKGLALGPARLRWLFLLVPP